MKVQTREVETADAVQTNENHIINQSRISHDNAERDTAVPCLLTAVCCAGMRRPRAFPLAGHISDVRSLRHMRTQPECLVALPSSNRHRLSLYPRRVASLSLNQEYCGANQPITSRAPRTRTRSDGGVAVEVRQVGGVDLLVRHARILDNRDDAQRRQLLLGESTHLGARLIDHARQ